jgi:hypothetical protein
MGPDRTQQRRRPDRPSTLCNPTFFVRSYCMEDMRAVVRHLRAAVSGQKRPIVPRLAALLRADVAADGAYEYPDKPTMQRPSQRRRGVAAVEF